jgi:ribosomal protein S15P/S13E
MSSDNLVTAIQHIAHDAKKIEDAFILLDRYNELLGHIESYRDDMADIMVNAQALGFKPAPFKKLAKYRKNPDILDGDAAEIEATQAFFDYRAAE